MTDTPDLSPDRLKALLAKLFDARTRVSDMAATGRRLRMSIPAKPDHDDDLVICGSIDEARSVIEALAARVGELDEDNARLERRVIELGQDLDVSRAAGRREGVEEAVDTIRTLRSEHQDKSSLGALADKAYELAMREVRALLDAGNPERVERGICTKCGWSGYGELWGGGVEHPNCGYLALPVNESDAGNKEQQADG